MNRLWNRVYSKLSLNQFSRVMKRNFQGSPTQSHSPQPSPSPNDHEQFSIQQARPYQVEILKQATEENTIVCLGTGTGKTFISVMLIRENQGQIKGNLRDDGKRTFFLVNTVPLAEQQANAVRQNTSLKVKHYTGDMGVDFWKKERWQKEFDTEADVLVMTAQILVNILTHGFFAPKNMNLLIMDECHNATKRHPYVRVMEFLPINGGPHIMGLTASIINEKYKKSADEDSIKGFLDCRMKALEGTLRSKCITCSDREATSKYATKPVETVLPYSSRYSINDCDNANLLIVQFKNVFSEAEEKFEKMKRTAKEGEVEKRARLVNVDYFNVINRQSRLGAKDACSIALDAVKLCQQILESLGPISTYDAIQILSQQLDRHEKRFNSQNGQVLADCKNVFQAFNSQYHNAVRRDNFGDPDSVIPMEPFITCKAHKFLKEVLLEEKLAFGRQGQELHAIVFVQRRCTAIILSKLIQKMVASDPHTYRGINSEYVLGHGFDENIRLADSFMRSNEQSKILTRFKAAEFNVLVATSVVEEGLDVRKCNLVVRFDGMNNYREYAQSKGRARAKDSKFIVMACEGEEFVDTERQLKVMQLIESVLFENCQDRELPTEKEIREQMYDEIDQLIGTIFAEDGSNARIRPHYAVSLLYRYCSFLQQDKYSSTNPYFRFHKCEDKTVQAECLLPMNFPLADKNVKGNWMPDRDTAKKDVASTICLKLKEMGELTKENLLPVDHRMKCSDFDQDEGEKSAEGTRKNRACYTRNVPKVLRTSRPFPGDRFHLYAIEMLLTEPYDRPSAAATWPLWYAEQKEGFGLILPARNIEKLPSFKLYTRSGGITVNLRRIPYPAQHSAQSQSSPASHFTARQQEAIENFNMYISQHFYRHYVSEDSFIYRDSDDDLDRRIARAVVVPLKKNALVKMMGRSNSEDFAMDVDSEETGHSCSYQPIDFDLMHSIWDDKAKFPDATLQPVIRKTYLDNVSQNKRLYYVISLSDKIAGDPMEGSTTFADYYKKRYSRQVDPNSCLMEVVPASQSAAYQENQSIKDSKKETSSSGRKEELVPELCEVASSLSSQTHMQAILLPHVLYRIECELNAVEFRNRLLSYTDLPENDAAEDGRNSSPMEIPEGFNTFDEIQGELRSMELRLNPKGITAPRTQQILESLTTRQALFDVDLERLEMLGDSFLKQAVSVLLFFQYPTFNEGRLTMIRKSNISNRNLRQVAIRLGVPAYVNNSHFGDKNRGSENKNPLTVWLPPCYKRSFPDESGKGAPSQAVQGVEKEAQQQSAGSAAPSIHHDAEAAGFEDVTDYQYGYQVIQDKSLADCVEALIGAFFRSTGVDGCLRFMNDVLGIPVMFKHIFVGGNTEDEGGIVDNDTIISKLRIKPGTGSRYSDFPKPSSAIRTGIDPFSSSSSSFGSHSSKAELQELYQRGRLSEVEQKLGYEFKDKSHLVQATTHLSYAYNTVTGCYQEYEFLGDAILDFLVTLHVYKGSRSLSPGQLTSIKSALVNNNVFSFHVIELGLHKFLAHSSPALTADLNEFIDMVTDNDSDGGEALYPSLYESPFIVVPPKSDYGLIAPKVFGDLLESLAGAVFLDCGLDLVTVWSVFYPIMKNTIDMYVDDTPKNPKREMHERFQDLKLECQKAEEMTRCIATYKVGSVERTSVGLGKNKKTAETVACLLALRKLNE